ATPGGAGGCDVGRTSKRQSAAGCVLRSCFGTSVKRRIRPANAAAGVHGAIRTDRARKLSPDRERKGRSQTPARGACPPLGGDTARRAAFAYGGTHRGHLERRPAAPRNQRGQSLLRDRRYFAHRFFGRPS